MKSQNNQPINTKNYFFEILDSIFKQKSNSNLEKKMKTVWENVIDRLCERINGISDETLKESFYSK